MKKISMLMENFIMNMRMIEDISNFIFVEDELEQADVIMIPGGLYSEFHRLKEELE